jgi:hypothetical protein
MTIYSMTKSELVAKRGLEDKSFDYTLPQDWLYAVHDWCKANQVPFTYHELVYGFVWLYDSLCGRPYPLTCYTHWLLSKLPSRLGCNV